jgi:Na+/H+-translocating membrane pyrophosphatase
MEISQIAPLFGMLGLLMAFAVYRHVVAQPAGTGLMTEIAESIQTGAMAFIRPEPTPHAAWRSRQAPHGLSAVVLPPLIGFVLGKQALGGFLAGATLRASSSRCSWPTAAEHGTMRRSTSRRVI